jgi:hypothetical protein
VKFTPLSLFPCRRNAVTHWIGWLVRFSLQKERRYPLDRMAGPLFPAERTALPIG